MSADMAMNVSDLQALRLVITAERSDTPASACMLATAWASRPPRTTNLLDRLTASGRLTRSPHPRDRGSLVVRARPSMRPGGPGAAGHMHKQMAQVAAAVPEPASPPSPASSA